MTEKAVSSKKILTSRQEILDYAGISKDLYLKFVRVGFLVLYIGGRCYAHTDNIDDFFKMLTKAGGSKDLPEEVIMGQEEKASEQ